MSQRSRFFDSTAGDRVYTADAWAQVISAVAGDGVIYGDASALEVAESSPADMSVDVDLGQALVQGRYFEVYSAAETISISAADPTNPRYDIVVVRLDPTARTVSLAVVEGTPGATPSEPSLTQTPGGTWELPLARVAVAAGATSIVDANLRDLREPADSGPGGVPAGTIMATARASAPPGWLLCDGNAYYFTRYPRLYAAIGTTFGAFGSDQFRVPDLRGKFPLGKAASGTGSSLAGTGGSLDHTHTGPSHTHTGPSHTHATDTIGQPDSTIQVSDVAGNKAAVPSPTHSHSMSDQITTASGTAATGASGTGASGSGNPPFLTVNYIIKT